MTWSSQLNRALRMSARELGSRGIDAGRRMVDRWRVHAVPPKWHREQLAAVLSPAHPAMRPVARALGRAAWSEAHERLVAHLAARPARFVVHPGLRDELRARLGADLVRARLDAEERGRRLVGRSYDLLGYHGMRFDTRPPGDIDWHLDPVSGRRAPRECWADVPYLEPSIGDHKVTWELNRHQHWLELGRAWWLTGDAAAFRDAFTGELESWLRENPPLVGINWASALELAFRCLSWTWAAELFADPALVGGEAPWTVDLLLGLDRQLCHIEAHLSRYFSPNTHLLGEGLALYVCGVVFPELRQSHARIATGRAILLEGAGAQVLPDGGHAERSLHYHRYALDFYLLALSVARLVGDDALSGPLTPVAARMATFLRALCDDEGRYALIGDDDGGDLVPIAGHEAHARTTLGWAAALLDRAELAVAPIPESVAWLTLTGSRIAVPATAPGPRTALFADTGYLAARRAGSHLVFDVGPHGFMNGGHAHADALAVWLVVRGQPLLVDAGTGTYTIDPAARDRTRSSRAHNTLSLDGRSQSEPRGPFHWATMASGELRYLAVNPSFDYAEGDTSAWAPAIHERMIVFVSDDTWIVADRVLGGGLHEATVAWQLDPAWVPESQEHANDEVRLGHTSGLSVRLAVPGARMAVRRGEHPHEPGTVAPVYGRYVPSHVIEATLSATAPFWIVTVVDLLGEAHVPRGGVRVQPVSDASGAPIVVLAGRGDSTDITLCRGRSPRELVTVPIGDAALATDARMAHLRLDREQRVERLCVADATLLRYDGPRAVTLTADEPVQDLAAVFTGRGSPLVETSASRRSFSLEIDGPSGGPGRDGPSRRAGRETSARTR